MGLQNKGHCRQLIVITSCNFVVKKPSQSLVYKRSCNNSLTCNCPFKKDGIERFQPEKLKLNRGVNINSGFQLC